MLRTTSPARTAWALLPRRPPSATPSPTRTRGKSSVFCVRACLCVCVVTGQRRTTLCLRRQFRCLVLQGKSTKKESKETLIQVCFVVSSCLPYYASHSELRAFLPCSSPCLSAHVSLPLPSTRRPSSVGELRHQRTIMRQPTTQQQKAAHCLQNSAQVS